jgi:hypothetical protein
VEGSLSRLLEEAADIAWVYLERSGELGNGDAARFLTDTIERMIRQGHRNRMYLANKAINKYLESGSQQSRSQESRSQQSRNHVVTIREDA